MFGVRKEIRGVTAISPQLNRVGTARAQAQERGGLGIERGGLGFGLEPRCILYVLDIIVLLELNLIPWYELLYPVRNTKKTKIITRNRKDSIDSSALYVPRLTPLPRPVLSLSL